MTDEPTQRPPDRPVVPRPKRSLLTAFAVGISVLVVGGYGEARILPNLDPHLRPSPLSMPTTRSSIASAPRLA